MNLTFPSTSVFILLFAASVSAQPSAVPQLKSPISRGHVTIGTTIGFGSFEHGKLPSGAGVTTYDVRLAPSAGYFITDHWMLSANAIASFAGSNIRSSGTSQQFGAGIGARYYAGRSLNAAGEINRLRFYAEAGGGYTRSLGSYYDGSTRYRMGSNNYLLTGGVGVNYLLNQNVALESGLGVQRVAFSDQYGTSRLTQMRLDIGIRVFLNRK